MDLSIIIPYHNEGPLFIRECIDQLRATIDVEDYEIIVVDDGSLKPLVCDGHKLIRHEKNRGVGAAFDTGVKHAESDNLILMACDIRFMDNGWASKMLEEIEAHQESFTCTTCIGISKDKMDPLANKSHRMNGATIEMFNDSWQRIINAKWLPKLEDNKVPSHEIPCILGAFYGVKKDWYEYVDGFAMHRMWGTLEPYISLKSWFFGGNCRVVPAIETAHIFKKDGTHGTPISALFYNKILVSTLLFDHPETNVLLKALGDGPEIRWAHGIMAGHAETIGRLKREYAEKICIDRKKWFDDWDIKTRFQ